ncbi:MULTISPECIES: DUF692 domain-containing protein [Streptomyces]|uniref:DUF692 domain-containing protein n=1 Tax=Streptomyces TaxID=1883 RepID=UPI001675EFBC|nr:MULTISPECIES: DUF692 domain-containing protein [Streptomyces]MBD3577934.1 DUF692 domain-containing protein [Streptomyces sp. KD18]
MAQLGVGIGWRPEIADAVERLPGLDWVEVVAENICPGHLPEPLQRLLDRGVRVVPHGVSLGLGGAERPDAGRLAALAERAVALGAPLVTEHIAFVRTASPALEAGHLLPVQRTRDALDVLCENVRIAQEALPVPLALENIAALVRWPGEELTEAQFLAELVERTGVRLLIDVANLHTNRINRGEDPAAVLAAVPPEALAYVHVAGGVERDGVWHDTHAHPVPPAVLDVLADLAGRMRPAGVLLERDDAFPPEEELAAELAAIRSTLEAAAAPVLGAPAAPAAAVAGVGAAAVPATDGVQAPAAAAVAAGAGAPAGAAVPAVGSASAGALPDGAHGVPATVGAAAARGSAGPGAPAAPGGAPGAAAATGPVLGGAGAQAASGAAGAPDRLPAARTRVGLEQAALLSALVAGTPVPEGFDRQRVRVQARALAAKRADIVAKVAPELPELLGGRKAFREAFLGYARHRPMPGGYRRDALDFAEHLLVRDLPADPAARRRLTVWWRDRAGPKPPGRLVRWARALTGRAA